MALNRIAKKYGINPNEVTGKNYRTVMQDIIAQNSQSIAEATAKLSDSHWIKARNKVRADKRFILPDVSEVLPGKDVHIKKAAEQGMLITDTLREELSQNLRDSLNEFKTKVTGEQAFIRRRGVKAGTINPKLISEFEKSITKTFENYIKIDPKYGVPSNVHTIAVTEARSTINEIKKTYNDELLNRNPKLSMEKTWIQNKELARKPRQSHSAVDGQTIKYNEKFRVPRFKKDVLVGYDAMDGPHDPTAPLEQIIGCNCDIEYRIVV